IFGGKDYRKLSKLVKQGFAQCKSEEYRLARTSLLQALEFRKYTAGTQLLDWILMTLGNTWVLTDEYDEGIAFFAGYIQRHPDDAIAYCERAGGYWYSGRLEEAVNDYTRCLELKPDEILPLAGRAQVLVEIGLDGRALEELDHVLRVLQEKQTPDPSRAEWYKHSEAFVRRARGVVLSALGRADEAMKEFETSIALSPNN